MKFTYARPWMPWTSGFVAFVKGNHDPGDEDRHEPTDAERRELMEIRANKRPDPLE